MSESYESMSRKLGMRDREYLFERNIHALTDYLKLIKEKVPNVSESGAQELALWFLLFEINGEGKGVE